jgi:hypothetical protein
VIFVFFYIAPTGKIGNVPILFVDWVVGSRSGATGGIRVALSICPDAGRVGAQP